MNSQIGNYFSYGAKSIKTIPEKELSAELVDKFAMQMPLEILNKKHGASAKITVMPGIKMNTELVDKFAMQKPLEISNKNRAFVKAENTIMESAKHTPSIKSIISKIIAKIAPKL